MISAPYVNVKKEWILVEYLLTVLCVLTLTVQSIAIKEYNKKGRNGPVTFSVMKVFVAFLFFLVTAIVNNAAFGKEVIPYSALFALCYSCSMVGYVMAVSCGSLAITAVVKSYALIIPTIFGVLVWGEKLELHQYIGFVCILVSLFLVGGDFGKEEAKLSLKWLFFTVISFFGEGFCSVTQKTQQKTFDGKYDSSFMVASLAMVIAVFMVYILIKERENLKNNLKAGLFPALYGGIGNGATNLIVLAVPAVLLPAAVFFPVLSAGQIVLTSVLSVLVYKEKLAGKQVVAILFGVAAIILLNV